MKITAEQIDQLYAFTRKFNVEYYDLQTELVDHLANAIEEQWETDPEKSFDIALFDIYLKFGVPGFNDIVEERRGWLQDKYNKIAWGYLKGFFKLPLIIFTVSLLAIFTFYVDENNMHIIQGVLFAVLVCFTVYNWLSRMIAKYSKAEKEVKKWLFEEVLRKHKPINFFHFFFFFSFVFPDFKAVFSLNVPPLASSLYDSAFIVYLVLYIYIIEIVIPSKAEQYLKETYPEYEFSK